MYNLKLTYLDGKEETYQGLADVRLTYRCVVFYIYNGKTKWGRPDSSQRIVKRKKLLKAEIEWITQNAQVSDQTTQN